MSAIHRVLGYLHRVSCKLNRAQVTGEPQLVATGWDKYATEWNPAKLRVLPTYRVRYLGDEWTAEDVSAGGTTYGLTPDIIANFDDYINKYLLNPYLPSCAMEGLEIGPGGGRLTVLLAPRTKVLHLAETSQAMLRHLKERFVGVNNVHYYHTDGMTLPALRPGSLDYVIAFDVFVHFEARLVYWYLRQVAHLLKPGGTGIIHYANVLTPIGWQEFETRLEFNVQKRHFAAFGVMCPQLMGRFLEALELEMISPDTGLIPRDAIAVFRKPVEDGRK
jgi:SAM-dependent methyltransferase